MPDNPDEARARAEANFKKKEQQAKENEQVWAEHAAAEQAADKNRARLRKLRLAKEAADERAKIETTPSGAKPDRKSRPKKST
jgi:hypothetical protein